MFGVLEKHGNNAVGLRFTGCTTLGGAMETGMPAIIILAPIVGALLASDAPMVQYSIPLTDHYITNLLVINTEQLGNGSGSQLLR